MNLQPKMAYSVVNKNSRRVKCQDFFTLTEWPYPGTCSTVKSKSLMVVNLLIGTAEDQDRLEKYLTKGPIKVMELCQPKLAK